MHHAFALDISNTSQISPIIPIGNMINSFTCDLKSGRKKRKEEKENVVLHLIFRLRFLQIELTLFDLH